MDAVMMLDEGLVAFALCEGFNMGAAVKFLQRAHERGVDMTERALVIVKQDSPVREWLSVEAGPFPPTGEVRLIVSRAWIATLIVSAYGVPVEKLDALPQCRFHMILAGRSSVAVAAMTTSEVSPPPTPESELN